MQEEPPSSNFHLVVPGSMSVERSHEICDRLEAALQKGEGTVIMIHVEPDHEARQASRSG